jgi:hypothetical protein
VTTEMPTTIYLAVTAEGLVATIATAGDIRVPLIAWDEESLRALHGYCERVSTETSQTVSIICFTRGSLYESFLPVATGD